jgi:hypothetical protein
MVYFDSWTNLISHPANCYVGGHSLIQESPSSRIDKLRLEYKELLTKPSNGTPTFILRRVLHLQIWLHKDTRIEGYIRNIWWMIQSLSSCFLKLDLNWSISGAFAQIPRSFQSFSSIIFVLQVRLLLWRCYRSREHAQLKRPTCSSYKVHLNWSTC